MRLFTANNKYVRSHDNHANDTHWLLIDALFFYDGILEKFLLTLNSFQTTQIFNLNSILETSNQSEFGNNFDVDFDYPDKLHDGHHDFSSAPTKRRNDYKETLELMGEKHQFSSGRKLIKTLNSKKNYTLHYEKLETACQFGI